MLLIGIAFMPQGAYAFGAGNIPSLAAIEGVNFRHGDIEDTLASLIMSSSGSIFSRLTGGKKFDGLAIKQVYFGNWLRDYSQAIDLGTLTKGVSPELIRIILWIMAFTEFGYGTNEFEVTSERLGVYRAEEHIDNPKGYGEGYDAPSYDERLRGPVDPEEYEVDRSSGLKNYIRNEKGGWPTSSEYVRKSLQKCIELGRKARDGGEELDQFEAFRLLGQSLHTLEDFSAHTNYCELVLISLGHENVFPHVGKNCTIELNGETVYPVVTGTFGGKDFLHSLMGSAQDSLSQMELADIQSSLTNGANSSDASEKLKEYLGMLPNFSGGDDDEESGTLSDKIDSLNHSGEPSMDPEEIIERIYPFIEFRDNLMKKVEAFFEAVPLLPELKQNVADSLTLFIMGNIQPILEPIINTIIDSIHEGTEVVVNDDEQFRVWNDPDYDNPTHSQLAKDHFATYLNEPAGKIATVIVSHVVPLVVQAWEDPDIDVNDVVASALEVFHHPAMASTSIQRKMRETLEEWVNNLEDLETVIEGLSSEGVRNGKHLKTAENVAETGEEEHAHTDSCGHNSGFNIPKRTQDYEETTNRLGRLDVSGENNGRSNNYTRSEETNYGQNSYNGSQYNEQEDRPQPQYNNENESRGNSYYGRGDEERNDRPYGNPERNERPNQGYEREERPRQNYEREERPSQNYEREERSYGNSEREERPYGNSEREDRPYGGRGDFGGEERPEPRWQGGEEEPSFGRRNNREDEEGNGYRRPSREREYQNDYEPRRPTYGEEREESGYEYRREYGNE